MFSSRNIHFAILGIILGAASGYILAFYQVQASMPQAAPRSSSSSGSSGLPGNHPNVSTEQLEKMFKEALAKNPDNPELMTKYANFLFNLGRFPEAGEWFQKVLAIKPGDLDVMTDYGTALWNAGLKDKAMTEYQSILKVDPKHIPTLHNVVVAHVDNHDVASAEQILKQIEQIDPKYEGLDTLRKSIAEAKAGK